MSSIEDSVCTKLLDRAEFGLKKYGVTLERTDLTELDWLTHLSEELMDGANYIEVLIQSKQEKSISSVEKLYSYLRQYIDYNPLTGLFIWVDKPNKKVKLGSIVGTLHQTGYIRIKLQGKVYPAHRLAWFYTYGSFPENFIDHINGIRTDNRLSNLRKATQKENQYNAPLRVDNTSGIKGVSFSKKKGKWQANINFDGTPYHLGYFESIEEAKEKIETTRIRLHKEFTNHGEFIITLPENIE